MKFDPEFKGHLYALFVVSPKVTPEPIYEFLEAAREELTLPADDIDPYCFSIQRNFADAQKELERTTNVDWAYGAQPPTIANEKLDFEHYSLDQLAEYVLESFGETRNSSPNSQMDHEHPIDNEYFVVMDARSAKDRTMLLVNIPYQIHNHPSGSPTYNRDRPKRDDYTKTNLNEEWSMEDSDGQELKPVRMRFAMARHVEMMKDGFGDLGDIVIAYRRAVEDGVEQ